jgi:nicotinic acid mononucleotide adenylyltransferase
MRKLEKFSLYEAPGKGEVVFTFGRFNPPTTGHEKLINKVKSVAGSNDYKIFPSYTQNQNKDQ